MAKRRLNKKVALVGSAVLVLIMLGAIFVMLRLGEDVQELVREADSAIAQKDYKRAEGALRGAYGSAKTDEMRKDVLNKLVSVYIETDQWGYALWCWNELIRIDPRDARSRYCKLMYFYLGASSMGRSGAGADAWEAVRKETSDFLTAAERANNLDEDTAQWDIFGVTHDEPTSEKLQPLLYLLRGRSNLEMAVQGRTTNKDKTLIDAVQDLEKVLDLEPGNIATYQYLAEAAIERGKILSARGSYAEQIKIEGEAKALLERAVDIAPDNPQSHINLLSFKLNIARGASEVKDAMEALEKEYQALSQRFPSNANVYGEIAGYYADRASIAGPELGPRYLDESIKAAEKAMALAPESVNHATRAADLYYREYSLYGDVASVGKAVEIAKQSLTLPGAQDTEGPRKYVNLTAKHTLNTLIAHCAVEQLLDRAAQLTEDQNRDWLLKAEAAVHAIEQIQTSEDNPQVIQWRGMLNLAKGRKSTAVRELYTAYQRLKALKPASPPWPVDLRFGYLCHRLAQVLKDSGEDGAVMELLVDGLNSYVAIIKPQARLDYADIGLKFSQWTAVRENVRAYERNLGVTDRTRTLRVKCDIGAGQFDQVDELLAEISQNDPNRLRLKLDLVEAKATQLRVAIIQRQRRDALSQSIAQGNDQGNAQADAEIAADLKALEQEAADLVAKLLSVAPQSVELSSVITACRFYVLQNQLGNARALMADFIKHHDEDVSAKVFQAGLSEPDPGNIPQDRLDEIRLKVLSSVSDPVRRAFGLGTFYRGRGEIDRAAAEFKKVLDAPVTAATDPELLVFEQPEEVRTRRSAAGYVFDIALQQQNLNEAQRISDLARKEDLDACRGQVFAARLAMVREDFADALARINECLKLRPVFSRAYMLRSNINTALGKDEVTVLGDMRRAAAMNPLNDIIAKGLADALYRRNLKLAGNVTVSQIAEARKALEVAITLNPRDVQLLDLYAAYLAEDEPLRAIAILQDIMSTSPDLPHAQRLGALALDSAKKQTEANIRAALFDVAKSALDEGRRIDPQDVTVLQLYAEYHRARGEDSKAEQLLQSAKSDALLWRHYIHRGQYAQAAEILNRLYRDDPKVRDVLAGLLLVSERTRDADGVVKYAGEIIDLDKSDAESYLVEIQSYLRVGLIQQVERKLESFTEKFPDEPRTLLLRAWLAMRKGQLEKALALANKNLEIDQENAVAWRLRGEINLFMVNVSAAVSDLMRSKALLDEPETRVSLAKAYLQQRRYEDAITELKNTVNASGASDESRTLLEHIYTRLGRESALREFYNETITRYPESVQWLNRAGSFAISTGEFEKGAQLYERACRLRREANQQQGPEMLAKDSLYLSAFDGYLRALVSGAGIRGRAGWDPKKLDKVFEEGRKHVDGTLAPIVYFRMAQAKEKLGDKETAVDYCRRAVDAAGDNETVASEVLLRMYLLLGPKEVTEYCEEKLRADPDSLPANITMYNLCKISGDHQKALRHIDKCIELVPPDSPSSVNFKVKRAEILTFAYGRTSDKQYLAAAIAEYESLSQKQPNNHSVLNNLAYMLADSGERLQEALEYGARAAQLRPNDPSVSDTYGYVLYKNGKHAEAAEKLAFALQQYQQNETIAPPEVYEHLGMVRESLGAKKEALAAYKEAMETGSQTLSEAAKQRLTKAIERLSR